MADEDTELNEADYAKLEKLVAKIQRELAPDAEVLHNVKLPGKKSERTRQIDVLLRQRVAQYEILIVIDCKDYKSKVDVKGVEEFWGLIDDVGAQKGVLVCPAGFSEAAKTRAQKLQIDLYSPVDTDPHKWQARVKIPAVCDYRSAALSFGVSVSSPLPFRFGNDLFTGLTVYAEDGRELGTCYSKAIERWNNGEFPSEPGTHERVSIFPEPTVLVDNGYGTLAPAELFVGLKVQQQLFFGQFPILRMSGFKDEISGGVITNAFEVGIIAPEEIEKGWKRIDTIEDAPVPPTLVLSGLVAWPE